MIPAGLEAQGRERSSLGLRFKKRFLQKIKTKKKVTAENKSSSAGRNNSANVTL